MNMLNTIYFAEKFKVYGHSRKSICSDPVAVFNCDPAHAISFKIILGPTSFEMNMKENWSLQIFE